MILKTELQGDAYNAMSADDAFAALSAGEVFDNAFTPRRWPSVSPDGTVDQSGQSPPISGFPNAITRQEFDAAWTAAGRS